MLVTPRSSPRSIRSKIPTVVLRCRAVAGPVGRRGCCPLDRDRKSTRLNSSHVAISYAVFCLKKYKFGFTFILDFLLLLRFNPLGIHRILGNFVFEDKN